MLGAGAKNTSQIQNKDVHAALYLHFQELDRPLQDRNKALNQSLDQSRLNHSTAGQFAELNFEYLTFELWILEL